MNRIQKPSEESEGFFQTIKYAHDIIKPNKFED